jgi:hypothetical protein
MTALLLTMTGVLALLVVGVAALEWRLSARLVRLEQQLAVSGDAHASSRTPVADPQGSHDRGVPARAHAEAEFVITHLGEARDEDEVESTPAPTLPAGQFADVLLREGVIKGAGLVHGLRRALSPENRNRIRFEMRREVKRSRKQRRADLREARREWEARQRAMIVDERAGTAA